MRLRIGPVPDAGIRPEPPWRPLREPGSWLMQLCALPIGVAMAYTVRWVWFEVGLPKTISLPRVTMIAAFASLVLVIFLHELLHAMAYPRTADGSPIIGVWPSRGLFYAHFDGVPSRNRFVIVFAVPLLVITFLPLLVVALAPTIPSQLLLALAWCSIWNALFSCGDVFGIALLLWQVRRNAAVRNVGFRTYWKCQLADYS